MKKLSVIIGASMLVAMASCGSTEYNNDPKEPTVGQRLDTTINDIKTSAEEAKTNMSNATDTTKSDLENAAEDVKDGAKDAWHDTKKVVKKVAKKAEEKTEEVDNDLKK